MKHPIQPLALDTHGVLRFKPNKIVQFLLETARKSNVDLNTIACMSFTKEDHEQLAQLIGYSLGGFGDLSYVSDETYNAAERMYNNKVPELEARDTELRTLLHTIREQLRAPISLLYSIHPDDLNNHVEL